MRNSYWTGIEDNSERMLGIDYGEKRIGIAITDPLNLFAYPLETLFNDNSFFEGLKNIISKYTVKTILLGYPLKEDGSKTVLSEKIIKFSEDVKSRTGLPVILRDERYTSEIASQRILESVSSKKKRRDKGLIDRNAAAVILEEYLSELKNR